MMLETRIAITGQEASGKCSDGCCVPLGQNGYNKKWQSLIVGSCPDAKSGNFLVQVLS